MDWFESHRISQQIKDFPFSTFSENRLQSGCLQFFYVDKLDVIIHNA